MKFLKELPDEEGVYFTKEELLELYEQYKQDNKPALVRKPETKVTLDMADRAATELVEEVCDDVEFLVNPVSKKWIKKDSAAGKLLVKLIA
jgi:electron transfer flavoprotein alpha subunit